VTDSGEPEMRSLYWKITLPFILLVIVSMSALGLYLVNNQRHTQIENIRSSLTDEAKLVADAAIPDFLSAKQDTELDSLAKKIGADIQARVTLIATDGRVLGDSLENPAQMENHASRPEVSAALKSGYGVSDRFSTTAGESMLYVAVAVNNSGQTLGVSRVALPLTTVNQSVNSAIRHTLLGVILATLLVILAASFITRMITRSTRQVTRAAVRIAAGHYDHSIAVQSDDELGKLGHAFNKMSLTVKESMQKISDEKNKLSSILYTLNDGVIMTDTRGNILLANPAAENLFEFKEASALGKPLIEAVFNHEVENLLKQCLATLAKQVNQVDTSSGRFLRVYAVPLKTEQLAGAVILLQDLTELRNLQTMRRQFVGNVSHDLKTPLAGIKIIIDTLQDGAINDPAAATDFLNRAAFEVDSMTQLVNELIELTRIETGAAQLNIEDLDLNKLVRETAIRLAPQSERKQLLVNMYLAQELPLVKADRERLQQVIGNILYNAIKFTPTGGQIDITSSVSDHSVLVQVKDNGIGISREDLVHIFERFFKADKSRSHEGSGLGLAIAKHIIQAHNGKIWVESQEGRGSTFSFSLPYK
jgi:two-component system, OmpR family, phosphate regulon sensor histidine kinase PhoR